MIFKTIFFLYKLPKILKQQEHLRQPAAQK